MKLVMIQRKDAKAQRRGIGAAFPMHCNSPKSFISAKILPRITRIARIQKKKSASSAQSAVNSAFGCGLAVLPLCAFAPLR
jgi:hypothetical protein